jgi:hypothetical protein
MTKQEWAAAKAWREDKPVKSGYNQENGWLDWESTD